MKKVIDKYYWLLFICLTGVLALLCFYRLGDFNLRPWDELRHGINAFEMMKNDNYLVNSACDIVDYSNFKPPLHFYFVIFGYKIFGNNLWGLRFFSALAYLILGTIIALFLKIKVNKLASLISIIILCTCNAYFEYHFIRTGDADSLFILFIGIALICLFLANDNSNWLHITGLMFALAFLTKASHAFFLIPIVFFYYLSTKLYKEVKWWQYITCSLCALVPILIWAIARYSYDGWTFFHGMFVHDLFVRSTLMIDGVDAHNYPTFFLEQLRYCKIQLICLILFLVNLTIKLIKKQRFSNLDKLCLITFFSIFIIYTFSQTKHTHYLFPAVVPLTLAGATSTIELYKYLKCLFTKILISGTLIITALFCFYLTVHRLDLQILFDNYQIIFVERSYHDGDTAEIYFENVEINHSPQYSTYSLILEWELDSKIKWQDGGFETFLLDDDSYLLISEETLKNKTLPEYIQIVGSGQYTLCYNAMHK